jgi:hypothetical protein
MIHTFLTELREIRLNRAHGYKPEHYDEAAESVFHLMKGCGFNDSKFETAAEQFAWWDEEDKGDALGAKRRGPPSGGMCPLPKSPPAPSPTRKRECGNFADNADFADEGGVTERFWGFWEYGGFENRERERGGGRGANH